MIIKTDLIDKNKLQLVKTNKAEKKLSRIVFLKIKRDNENKK